MIDDRDVARASCRASEWKCLRTRQLLRRGQQSERKLAGVGSFCGVGPAGTLEHAPQRPEVGGHFDRRINARHERRDRRVGREGHATGDGLDEHQGEGVDVALAVGRFAAGLLGARVPSRAQHRAGRFGPGRFGQRASEPEVADAQPSLLAEQEVGRLDVAVHEAARVRVLEATGRLEPDHQRLRRCEPAAGVEHGAQGCRRRGTP